MKLKIVRDDEPNEDGRWIEIDFIETPKPYRWTELCRAVAPFVPAGHHVVAVKGD